jgi:hypothetical protein
VRRIVPYNLMQMLPDGSGRRFPNGIRTFRTFYETALANGQDIMVSFQFRCLNDVRSCYDEADRNFDYVPPQQEWIRSVRAFKREFSRVRVLSAFNEPNHRFQPTRASLAGPRRAALYTYLLDRFVCKTVSDPRTSCRVVAGDFAQDTGGAWRRYMTTYLESLRSRYQAPGSPSSLPTIWGFHPYVDVKLARDPRTTTTGTDRFVSLAPRGSRIWLTEVGSRVDSLDNGGERRNGEAGQHAEVVSLFDRLAPSHLSIERVYYYAFCAPEGAARLDVHDSGLLGGFTLPYAGCAGQPPRRAYDAFQARSSRSVNP